MQSDRRTIRCFLSLILSTLLVLIAFSTSARALPLQIPEIYQGKEEITGWFISEKLDGIRGYWDGQRLLTREGNIIHAPAWFTAPLPSFELDGELWAGRGNFETVQSTVLDQTPSPSWQDISYNIFEVPHGPGDFPARLGKAKKWFENHRADHVRIIPQTVCIGRDHLFQVLEKIANNGGEGVIVKDPTIPYVDGTEQRALKLKPVDHAQGVVVGRIPGKGRFAGCMGSLTIQMGNGVTVHLGTGFSLDERRNPPRIGEVVIFKHYGFSKTGKPRFASFVKVKKP